MPVAARLLAGSTQCGEMGNEPLQGSDHPPQAFSLAA